MNAIFNNIDADSQNRQTLLQQFLQGDVAVNRRSAESFMYMEYYLPSDLE